MKHSGDRYPHKPSPGHTLDEVLKSLRDLIRNDLPAGLTSPPPDEAHPDWQSEIDAPPPPDPDPTSHDLVSEVVAGLERELAELDELDRPAASPMGPELASEQIAPDEPAAHLEASAELFSESDVRHAFDDELDASLHEADPEENFDDAADTESEITDPVSGVKPLADDGDDLPHEDPESALDAELVTDADADADTASEVPGEPEPEILEQDGNDHPEFDAGAGGDTDSGIGPDPEPGPEPRLASPPDSRTWPGRQQINPFGAATRLRDSLALIAPSPDTAIASWRSYPVPASSGPPNAMAPSDSGSNFFPESEAIPLLDDAIESDLPPDFAVRVRAIAIQVAARLDHEMRRAGRTPIAHDLVPTLARILEEALAQEFAQHQNDNFGEKLE